MALGEIGNERLGEAQAGGAAHQPELAILEAPRDIIARPGIEQAEQSGRQRNAPRLIDLAPAIGRIRFGFAGWRKRYRGGPWVGRLTSALRTCWYRISRKEAMVARSKPAA